MALNTAIPNKAFQLLIVHFRHIAASSQPMFYTMRFCVHGIPCPPEELFDMSKDPHQLTNLAKDANHAKALEQARQMLTAWTEQTGDTIPKNPTPHRHAPPQVVDGKIIPPGKAKKRNPHAEMPGAAKGAMTINHPGPIRHPAQK